jgi:hypothetical protein
MTQAALGEIGREEKAAAADEVSPIARAVKQIEFTKLAIH